MPGHVRLVAPGASALDALADAVRTAKAADPFAPVTVVAGTGAIRVHLRQALARATAGLVDVRILLLGEVAAEVVTEDATHRVRASRMVLRSIVARTLDREASYLSPIARHRGTLDEVALTYETLRFAPTDAIAVLAGLGYRRAELARLMQAIRSDLVGTFADDVDLLNDAAERLDTARTSALGPIIVHVPTRLRRVEADFLSALAGVTTVTVHLGTIGPDDAVTVAMRNRLAAVGFSEIDEAPRAPTSPRVEVALDARAEVRRARELVLEALRDGIHPSEIAIGIAATSPYLTLVQRSLNEAGLAWNGPASARLDASASARALLSFVALARLGSSRDRMLGFLGSAPLSGPVGSDIDWVEWDRTSRVAGIGDDDLEIWAKRLRAQQRPTDASEVVDEEEISVSARLRRAQAERTARAVEMMLKILPALGALIERARAIARFDDAVALCLDVLDQLFRIDPLEDDERRRSDEEVRAVLGQLSVLDRTNASASLGGFATALEAALDRPGPPNGAPGHGILVGRLEAIAALAPRLCVVVGAQEGNVPAPVRSGALLSTETQVRLGIDEAEPVMHIQRERYRLLACLAAATEAVALCSEIDPANGRVFLPSRFLPTSLGVASVAIGGGGGEALLPRLELDAARLQRAAAASAAALDGVLEHSSAQLRRSVDVQRSRAGLAFDQYSGRIGDPSLISGLEASAFSPTTLEAYATCPQRYFFMRELGIEVIEEPESQLGIEARVRGTIVHLVLERFVQVVMDDPAITEDAERTHLNSIAETVFSEHEVRGMTGRPALWRSERRRLLRILEAERRRDRERRLAGTVPVGVEYRFGTEDHPAVEVDAGDRALAFYGLVDRVDRLPSGALQVIDYKTGGDRYTGVTADPVDGGRHLQLALYARAASSLNGGTEAVARSAFRLLEHDGREIAIVPDVSVDARLTEVVAGLQRGIHAGQFPVRPGKGSRFTGLENCRFCDFVAACRVDRADQYAAIESLPELAALFALLVPPGPMLEGPMLEDSAVDDG